MHWWLLFACFVKLEWIYVNNLYDTFLKKFLILHLKIQKKIKKHSLLNTGASEDRIF